MGKVAYTLAGASKAASVSKWDIVEAINSQQLMARRIDGKPIVLRTDLKAWVAAAPEWQPVP